jgi:hypothetical protein
MHPPTYSLAFMWQTHCLLLYLLLQSWRFSYPSTTSSTHLFVWLHTPHKAHLKEILSSVRIITIRLTSFGQWFQLWELGIIWFCTSQIADFQEAFKLQICALYLIFLFIRVWMDKKFMQIISLNDYHCNLVLCICLLWLKFYATCSKRLSNV